MEWECSVRKKGAIWQEEGAQGIGDLQWFHGNGLREEGDKDAGHRTRLSE